MIDITAREDLAATHTVSAMYFSPTGTTRRIVSHIAKIVSERSPENGPVLDVDFTLPTGRERRPCFSRHDIVVFGLPVYGGRIPEFLLDYIGTVRAEGATAVAIVVYGNRDYDDALIELVDLLRSQGFAVAAAGAFIGEHSYSTTLGKERPDHQDMRLAGEFAARSADKILGSKSHEDLVVKGTRPYGDYRVPRDERGNPIDLSGLKPKTSVECLACGKCAEVCPMGSIDTDNPAVIDGLCIKCNACVKSCPTGAKYFDDPGYLKRKQYLETTFSARREPECFL